MSSRANWSMRLGLIAACAIMWSVPVSAADYPTSPVKLIVPYGAGGASDTMARYVAEELSALWDQQVVVENQPGSSGALAYSSLSKADSDGYTLGYATTSVAMNPLLLENVPYDIENDFAPIGKLLVIQNVLVVPSSLEAESVEDLIELAKSRPGELDYGSLGAGSTPHLATELFMNAAEVDIARIPYKSTTQGIADVVEGRLDMWIMSLPSSLSFIADGRLRALAVTGSSRSSALPDVPTLTEAGVPVEIEFWHGVLAPAGTDPEIVEAVNEALGTVIADPETKAWFDNIGIDLDPSTPDELGELVKAETQEWTGRLEKIDLEN